LNHRPLDYEFNGKLIDNDLLSSICSKWTLGRSGSCSTGPRWDVFVTPLLLRFTSQCHCCSHPRQTTASTLHDRRFVGARAGPGAARSETEDERKMRRKKPIRGARSELEELRLRLAEAEETLRAIRSGEVDAIAVEGPAGQQFFRLQDPGPALPHTSRAHDRYGATGHTCRSRRPCRGCLLRSGQRSGLR
jgi:hypothetical protein